MIQEQLMRQEQLMAQEQLIVAPCGGLRLQGPTPLGAIWVTHAVTWTLPHQRKVLLGYKTVMAW